MTMFQGRGTRRYSSNQGLYFLSRQQITILSHYRVLYRQVPRPIVWICSGRSRSSVDSQFCTSLLRELHSQLLSTSLSSSLAFVQEFPVAAAHPLLVTVINRFRVMDVPAFGKQCCSLHSRVIIVSFSIPISLLVPLRRRRLVPPPPHHALSDTAGWLNQDRGREGFFFRCSWGQLHSEGDMGGEGIVR